MVENTHKQYFFFVDAIRHETTQTALTGAAIKELAVVPPTYQLFLEEHGDKPDRAVSDDEYVTLSGDEKHFFAVPSAVFGDK